MGNCIATTAAMPARTNVAAGLAVVRGSPRALAAVQHDQPERARPRAQPHLEGAGPDLARAAQPVREHDESFRRGGVARLRLPEAAVADEVEHVPRALVDRLEQVFLGLAGDPAEVDAPGLLVRPDRLIENPALPFGIDGIPVAAGIRDHGENVQRALDQQRLVGARPVEVADDRRSVRQPEPLALGRVVEILPRQLRDFGLLDAQAEPQAARLELGGLLLALGVVQRDRLRLAKDDVEDAVPELLQGLLFDRQRAPDPAVPSQHRVFHAKQERLDLFPILEKRGEGHGLRGPGRRVGHPRVVAVPLRPDAELEIEIVTRGAVQCHRSPP
jgi:hypothetical protein